MKKMFQIIEKTLEAMGTSLALIAAALAPQVSRAAVWTTTQQWSEAGEEAYTQWVQTSWNTQIFVNPGNWYSGLDVDCAHTVYAMRIIFSADHGYPFAIQDPTGGKNLITNDMTRFDNIADAGSRKRAFLSFIFEVANTYSLPNDTYPVAVSPSTIRSGVAIRTDEKSRHAWTVQAMDPLGFPHLVSSSMPARTQLMARVGFPTMGFVFPNGLDPASQAGFVAFRWPQYEGKPVWTVPGYSEQQYQIPIAQWQDTVQRMVASVQETEDAKLKRLLSSVCDWAAQRVTIVNEALQRQEETGGACMSPEDVENYSSPSNDQTLMEMFQELQSEWTTAQKQDASLDPGLVADLESVYSQSGSPGADASVSASGAYCPVEVAPGEVLSLGEIRERSISGLLSSNPMDPISYRWGDSHGTSPQAAACSGS